MGMSKRPGPAIAVLLVLAVPACGILSPEDGSDELAEARARWSRTGLDSYVWTVDRACYCGAFGEAEIRVVEGEKVSVVRTATGEPVPEAEARWFPTVEELFDVVERAIREADDLRAEYDRDTGAPLLVDVDWLEQAIDDEVRYTATPPTATAPPRGVAPADRLP